MGPSPGRLRFRTLPLLLQHTEPLGYPKYTEKVDSVGSLSSAGSTSSRSMHYGDAPELMLGLAYNESTGRLSVEVVKGSNFKNLASSKPPGVLSPRFRCFICFFAMISVAAVYAVVRCPSVRLSRSCILSKCIFKLLHRRIATLF